LDDVYAAGTNELFSKMAYQAAQLEGVKTHVQTNDTTSISLTGEYEFGEGGDTLKVLHGYSKDHRPDLKQVIHELVVSCDGGVPLHCQSCDGNKSDSEIFRKHVSLLKKNFTMQSDSLWIADSKLYNEETIRSLEQTRFLTRIPETYTLAKETIDTAFDKEWSQNEKGLNFQRFELEHFGIPQSWLVVWSEEGYQRAEKTLLKKQTKEFNAVSQECFHLQAQRFFCLKDAEKALGKAMKKWNLVQAQSTEIKEHKKHTKKGRPHPQDTFTMEYQVIIQIERKDLNKRSQRKAAFILGTSAKDLSDEDIIANYKKQGHVERGFRFLKDPYFFASSLYLKKPERIQSLLMIMTLSLLVYTIAQRRLRQAMEQAHHSIANQAGVSIQRPTMRWVFQIFWGINVIKVRTQKGVQTILQGLQDIHRDLLHLFSGHALSLYETT